MWNIAYQGDFLLIARKENKQLKIVTTAWPDHWHVIEEDISLGAANAVSHIATSAEIKEKYGITDEQLWRSKASNSSKPL